jgi:hypothetical protein
MNSPILENRLFYVAACLTRPTPNPPKTDWKSTVGKFQIAQPNHSLLNATNSVKAMQQSQTENNRAQKKTVSALSQGLNGMAPNIPNFS